MDDTHYSISEAGKLVGVESHVLRYWEDELQLNIPRNGKSHRYYTGLHIRLFQKIKELKEKGYQLKAIEQVLNKMLEGDEKAPGLRVLPKPSEEGTVINQEKLDQFQELMNHIIGNAIGQAMKQSSEAMSSEISRQVSNHMVQELEYMMRVNDEREEDRFKMLDETLRTYQRESKGKAEAAATKLPFFRRRKSGRKSG